MVETQISIYKLPMEKIIEHNYTLKNYTDEEAILNGELVPISGSQLTGKICDYYNENGLNKLRVRDAIINIVVPSASGRQTSKVASEYNNLAHLGFYVNGKHFVRLCAGSGQLRNNTITYVWDVMKDYLLEAIYCGISPEDLGEDFSVSKWNAYVGLSESGMRFLKTSPRVCVVSDYEEIKPHMPVDYIETTKESGKKRKTDKIITRRYYDDEEMDFAPLNSFDGQGLADPVWMKNIAIELGYLTESKGYVPSEYILRAPWCKGLVVAFDFKKYCKQYNVTTITDVYGEEYPIDEIDVLITTSQFKMWKVYKKYGGWSYHKEAMEKYNLHWGVVIANKENDDEYRALNYQYIQALDLDDNDIDALCKHTEDSLTKLCSGDVESVFRTLVGFSQATDENKQDVSDDITDNNEKPYASLLQKVVAHNIDLLNDTYIQGLIYREVEAKFNGAKIGKILCRGGYSFIVSDPVAQIQHIIKSHSVNRDFEIEVKGLIPAQMIYSNYWNRVQPSPDNVVLMRSPLVDSSEVTVCELYRSQEADRWYSHIKSGLILSVFDLNTLALQNCDFDGDRCFSSNDPTLIKGAQLHPVPILYPSAGTQLKGSITPDSIIEADVRGLNSAVGGLSNQATSLYALRDNYLKGSPEYNELSRRIKIISELVGVEIDKIKTGIPPLKPSSWNKERMPYEQYTINGNEIKKVPACSEEEQERISKHNSLIPDYKPLFMRYIYEALNKDLIKYDKAFDSACKYNSGKRLSDILHSNYDNLKDDEKDIVDRYYRYFPAIDSPCSMNKICKKFEALHRQLKKCERTRDMLGDFITPQIINEKLLAEINEVVDLFRRQKRFITRNNNISCFDSNKQIAKDTRERFNTLHKYTRNLIMNIVENNVQVALNYLIELVKRNQCTEAIIWAILDDLVLEVIPHKEYQKEAV